MKAKRRTVDAGGLEAMSDDDLQEIRFFGNLVARNGRTAYTATKEEQRQATEILKQRGTLS